MYIMVKYSNVRMHKTLFKMCVCRVRGVGGGNKTSPLISAILFREETCLSQRPENPVSETKRLPMLVLVPSAGMNILSWITGYEDIYLYFLSKIQGYIYFLSMIQGYIYFLSMIQGYIYFLSKIHEDIYLYYRFWDIYFS